MKWDYGLIRKFGSINHFRLLNQLSSEVKAYPLKRKRDTQSTNTKKNIDTSFIQSSQVSTKNEIKTNSIYNSNYVETPLALSQANQVNFNSNKNINVTQSNKIFNNTQDSYSRITESPNFSNFGNSSSIKRKENENTNNIDLIDQRNHDSNVKLNDAAEDYESNEISEEEQPIEIPITFMERLSQIDMR